MRAVVTRVKQSRVEIGGTVSGQIGQGLLVLLGVGPEDTPAHAEKMADKVCGLRIFEDENEKMNLNLAAVGGAVLVVSQFTCMPTPLPGGRASPMPRLPLWPFPCMSISWPRAGRRGSRSSTGNLAQTCRCSPRTMAR